MRILLVCMGNICRSPTAEGVLRHYLEQGGLAGRVEVDSAGTHGYHRGEPPDQRALKAAARRGFDLTRIRSRKVSDEDFERFDLILAMDRDNLESMLASCPEALREKLGLFMHHARTRRRDDVPDPYYGGPEGFEVVLDMLEDAAKGLVEHLNARGIE